MIVNENNRKKNFLITERSNIKRQKINFNLLEVPEEGKTNIKLKYNNKNTPVKVNHLNLSYYINNQNLNSTRKSAIQSFSKHSDKLLYIPCMNCGNEILFNEIEKHSSICLKINNDILKVERNEEQFELINYKLKKINDHLNNIFLGKADSVTDILKNEIKLYGKELYKYITDSINVEEESLDNIKFLKKISENCENLQTKNGQLSLSSSIIIDRVKVLINEKIMKIKVILRKKAEERNDRNKKIYETNINYYKNNDSESDTNNYNNYNVTNKIEEIQSDIENQTMNQLNNTLTSINSSVSSQSLYYINPDYRKKMSENISSSYNYNNELLQSKNSIDLRNSFCSHKSDINFDKRDFMKKVFKFKFEKLHSSHIGQHINPKDIYDESIRQGISRNDWDQFIINELNNPYKYAKKIMKNNRNVSVNRVFERVNKERLMDIINEE